MENSDKEIYEIIASLPIDLKRIGSLGDIMYEANLLIKSRFIDKIELDLNKFIDIPSYNKYGNILLITEVEGRRFIVYIENNNIVSVALSELKGGARHSGVKALALLLQLLKLKPLTFKLFEVAPELTDATEKISKKPREPSEQMASSIRVNVKGRGVEGKTKVPKASATVVFAEKVAQFKEKAKQVLSDIASASGCTLQDVKINISKGTMNVHVTLKKRMFSKCRAEEFKKKAEKDLELLIEMFDLALPVNITLELK